MSTTDLKPEQKARKIIDQMLNVAGWDIVDRKHYTTLSSAVAIEEGLLKNETVQKAHAEQLGKLQGQMKAQTEASAKQSKEFNESLKKMQETNGELNKSITKLTAQNTQAAKDLQAEKDRARDLERQLSEALARGGGNMWMWIAIIAIAACIAVLIFK